MFLIEAAGYLPPLFMDRYRLCRMKNGDGKNAKKFDARAFFY